MKNYKRKTDRQGWSHINMEKATETYNNYYNNSGDFEKTPRTRNQMTRSDQDGTWKKLHGVESERTCYNYSSVVLYWISTKL